MDISMPVGASREGKRLIMHQLAKNSNDNNAQPVLVLDGLAHYSSYLAAENAGIEIIEVPHNGHPTFKLKIDGYESIIDNVLDDSSKRLIGVLLTHSDYLYGNVTDPSTVGKICKKKGIPFIINGAYTIGIMPFSGKSYDADFITASGHKSMASSGPIGMIGCKDEYKDLLFPRAEIEGNWSKRTFPNKTSTLLGCPSVYGAPLATLMSSFPHVVERTKAENWAKELVNAKILADILQRIEGVDMIGIQPHQHTLMQFETPAFEEAARNTSKKGFFLYNELKSRGIIGIFPGMVKSMKLNTYGLEKEQIEYVANSFLDIAKKYGLVVN
jgi:Sep-tRNA:Cys-tRNA synthetase